MAYPTMQSMQHTFTLNMQPLQTHEDYPQYARSSTKPVIRARQIINMGVIAEHPCSACADLGQDCYRWEGTYSKCAYCTSKDRKRDECCWPGQKVSVSSSGQQEKKRKRRKITHNIYAPGADAASTADTTMSATCTLPTDFTPFPGASPVVSVAEARNIRSEAPSPESAFAVMATVPTTQRTELPKTVEPQDQASSNATLERVTALECQVSGLQSTVVDLLVKLDERTSCSSTPSEPQAVAAGCAFPPPAPSQTTATDLTVTELQARHLSNATAAPLATMTRRATLEWVQGSNVLDVSSSSSSSPSLAATVETDTVMKMEEEAEVAVGSKAHSIEHPEGYTPVNCSCATGP